MMTGTTISPPSLEARADIDRKSLLAFANRDFFMLPADFFEDRMIGIVPAYTILHR